MGWWRARVSPSGEGADGWRTAEPTAGATRARLPLPLSGGLLGPNALVRTTPLGSRGGYITHGNLRSPPNGVRDPAYRPTLSVKTVRASSWFRMGSTPRPGPDGTSRVPSGDSTNGSVMSSAK